MSYAPLPNPKGAAGPADSANRLEEGLAETEGSAAAPPTYEQATESSDQVNPRPGPALAEFLFKVLFVVFMFYLVKALAWLTGDPL